MRSKNSPDSRTLWRNPQRIFDEDLDPCHRQQRQICHVHSRGHRRRSHQSSLKALPCLLRWLINHFFMHGKSINFWNMFQIGVNFYCRTVVDLSCLKQLISAIIVVSLSCLKLICAIIAMVLRVWYPIVARMIMI